MTEQERALKALSEAYDTCAKIEFSTPDDTMHRVMRKACFDIAQRLASLREMAPHPAFTSIKCGGTYGKPPMHLEGQLRHGTRVRATESKNEVTKGDEGEVVAAWVKANVLVKWDNGTTTSLHRKRLELATPKMKTVRNLMSGEEVEIPTDTPLACDPSSETYWSM
jgi:hypothetical protein